MRVNVNVKNILDELLEHLRPTSLQLACIMAVIRLKRGPLEEYQYCRTLLNLDTSFLLFRNGTTRRTTLTTASMSALTCRHQLRR